MKTVETCKWVIKESVIHIFFETSCGGKFSLNYREMKCPKCKRQIEVKDESEK